MSNSRRQPLDELELWGTGSGVQLGNNRNTLFAIFSYHERNNDLYFYRYRGLSRQYWTRRGFKLNDSCAVREITPK